MNKDYITAGTFFCIGMLGGLLLHGGYYWVPLVVFSGIAAVSGVLTFAETDWVRAIAMVLFVLISGPFTVGAGWGGIIDLIHHSTYDTPCESSYKMPILRSINTRIKWTC